MHLSQKADGFSLPWVHSIVISQSKSFVQLFTFEPTRGITTIFSMGSDFLLSSQVKYHFILQYFSGTETGPAKGEFEKHFETVQLSDRKVLDKADSWAFYRNSLEIYAFEISLSAVKFSFRKLREIFPCIVLSTYLDFWSISVPHFLDIFLLLSSLSQTVVLLLNFLGIFLRLLVAFSLLRNVAIPWFVFALSMELFTLSVSHKEFFSARCIFIVLVWRSLFFFFFFLKGALFSTG